MRIPNGDITESCGWDRKRTPLLGKVLSPNMPTGKENVREQHYHRDASRSNA